METKLNWVEFENGWHGNAPDGIPVFAILEVPLDGVQVFQLAWFDFDHMDYLSLFYDTLEHAKNAGDMIMANSTLLPAVDPAEVHECANYYHEQNKKKEKEKTLEEELDEEWKDLR